MKRQSLWASCLAVVLATSGLAPAAGSPLCSGPRQATDPLSPPCIPTWSGDNGGETWTGVTGQDVTLVLYNDLGISGDLNAPFSPTDESLTHLIDLSGDRTNLVRTVKALVARLGATYQTYGRAVRLRAVPSALGTASFCANRESDIEQAILTWQPFGIVAVGSDMGCAAVRAARAGVPTFGHLEQVREALLREVPSYIHTFAPSIDQASDALGGFLCRTLAGPARFAAGSLAGSPRRFGLVFPSGSASPMAVHAAALSGALASGCGKGFAVTRSYRPGQPAELASAIAEAATAGVNSLVCLCQAESGDALQALSTAAALGYRPEWVWSPLTHMDRAMWQRRAPAPEVRQFGISDLWLAPAPPAQFAAQTAVAADPDLDPNPRWTGDLYLALRTAYTAVQLAGPNLTPSSLRSGLASFTPGGTGPSIVAGSFASPTPNSYTDTFVAWWWDASGNAPGDTTARGCTRLAREGARSTPTDWPADDLALFASGPCTGLLHRSQLDESPSAAGRSLPLP